ncbi:MAG: hypothetical protein WAT25_13475 [Paracoccaceae bacterium]
MEIKAIGSFKPTGTSQHQLDFPEIGLESGGRVPMPTYTRVQFIETTTLPDGKKRDRFRVQDFEYQGQLAYSTHTDKGTLLIDPPQYYGPCLVVWDKAAGEVVVSVPSDPFVAKVKAKAVSEPGVPDGTFEIRPWLNKSKEDGDFVCESYQGDAPHACHWWQMTKYASKGYCLHRGNVSAGCISVQEGGKWEEIYRILSKCRTSDGRSTGAIIVKGHTSLTS